jgi:hypothetical protein
MYSCRWTAESFPPKSWHTSFEQEPLRQKDYEGAAASLAVPRGLWSRRHLWIQFRAQGRLSGEWTSSVFTKWSVATRAQVRFKSVYHQEYIWGGWSQIIGGQTALLYSTYQPAWNCVVRTVYAELNGPLLMSVPSTKLLYNRVGGQSQFHNKRFFLLDYFILFWTKSGLNTWPASVLDVP